MLKAKWGGTTADTSGQEEVASGTAMDHGHYNPNGNAGQAEAQFIPGGSAGQAQAQFNQGFNPNGIPAQARPPRQPMNPEKRKRFIGIGVCAAAVAIVLIIIGVNASHTINLNKYVTITIDGYDSVGKATYDFDTDKFNEDYGKKIKYKKGSVSDTESKLMSAFGYDASDALLDSCVDASLDKTSGLSNGDKVTLKWDCDDKSAKQYFGYKLKYKDITEKVSGLKEAKKFDPFDGVDVTFSGIAPNGKAEVSGSSSEVSGISYSLDKTSGLSNGDKVTLSVTAGYSGDAIDYCIENYGMIPSPTTKEFTVSGLQSYLTSAKNLSDDDLNILKASAEDIIQTEINNDWEDPASLVEKKYIGTYFMNAKPDAYYWGSYNALYMIYKITDHLVYSSDNGSFDQNVEYYTYVEFDELQTDDDGKLDTNGLSGHLCSNNYSLETGVEDDWGFEKKFYYRGYQTLNDMKNDLKSSSYNFEENISE